MSAQAIRPEVEWRVLCLMVEHPKTADLSTIGSIGSHIRANGTQVSPEELLSVVNHCCQWAYGPIHCHKNSDKPIDEWKVHEVYSWTEGRRRLVELESHNTVAGKWCPRRMAMRRNAKMAFLWLLASVCGAFIVLAFERFAWPCVANWLSGE